ncbi:EYxxD motif small membrane protein [Fictibacillus aquaticus]
MNWEYVADSLFLYALIIGSIVAVLFIMIGKRRAK